MAATIENILPYTWVWSLLLLVTKVMKIGSPPICINVWNIKWCSFHVILSYSSKLGEKVGKRHQRRPSSLLGQHTMKVLEAHALWSSQEHPSELRVRNTALFMFIYGISAVVISDFYPVRVCAARLCIWLRRFVYVRTYIYIMSTKKQAV